MIDRRQKHKTVIIPEAGLDQSLRQQRQIAPYRVQRMLETTFLFSASYTEALLE